MSTFLTGVHPNPDIWALLLPDRTGLQMMTPRAKKWALSYKEMDDPNKFNNMLWVPIAVGSCILEDIENTNLNVLVDNWSEGFND